MKKIFLLLLLPVMVNAQTPKESINAPAESENLNVANPNAASKKQAKEIIESYRERVVKGESMSIMAMKYSQDPGSAQEGGLYKGVTKGMMVPEFEKIAFNLKPNQISPVFETQYGFHFIQLIAIRGELRDLRHILIMPK